MSSIKCWPRNRPSGRNPPPKWRVGCAPFAGAPEVPSAAEERGAIRTQSRQRWLALAAALLLAAGIWVAVVFVPSSGQNQPRPPAQQPIEGPAEAPADPLALATPEQILALKKERREQTLTWMREHNVWGSEASVVQRMVGNIDKDLDKLESYQVLLVLQRPVGGPIAPNLHFTRLISAPLVSRQSGCAGTDDTFGNDGVVTIYFTATCVRT